MATNEILQFANTATGGEILTQAAYVADPDRPDGHDPSSIARAELENKVLLQTSTIASAVAQFMADSQANNITDALSVSTLAGYLKTSIKNVSILFASAAGTANAITAAFSPVTTALGDGKFMIVRATAANSTSTPTFSADGLTAKTIVKGSNAALVNGDIAGAGFYMLLTYDSVLDKYVLNNPAVAAGVSSLGYFNAQDQKAAGTDGGTFTNGAWRTRTLNTTVTNTIAGASLAANVITLPAGTFKVTASAPALEVNRHQMRLYNVTDAATIFAGTSANTTAGTSSPTPVTTESEVEGIFTLAGIKNVEIQHRCSATQSSNGFGEAANFGEVEVYSRIFIEQIS